MHREDHEIVQEPGRLGIGARDELIDRLDQLVGAEDLGRVQAAVEPDNALALLRQCSSLLVGQTLGQRQPAGDFLVSLDLPVIFR